MEKPTGGLSPDVRQKNFLLAYLIMSPVMLAIFLFFPPDGVDWVNVFYKVARAPLEIYSFHINYPPWVAFLLAPLGLLPINWALAINCYLNQLLISLIVIKNGGGKIALALTLTSFPLLSIIGNGNIEWIAMIGFLLQNGWGMVFLLTKPQSGIFVVVNWFRRAPHKIRFFLPLALVIILCFIIWPNWPWEYVVAFNSLDAAMKQANFSPWPWVIPLGILLLYFSWKRSDDLLAVAGTLCLTPYFTAHSLAVAFALLAARSRKWGIIAWILLWILAIIKSWAAFQKIISPG